MDLRKVFDQTVRDLRREVNKKVLKVPEIEQKVLDATSNEPWGPHGTVMSEIAQATRSFSDYQMVMTILWKRLTDTGRNWRHVYKGLTVFDFLVAHGADRVIDELRENVYQIQSLIDFQYVEPNGKDQGVNIRKKAQALVSLLNDKEKIREVRQKASANRDKYQGYSSSGGIFKPSSYSSTGYRGYSDWDDDRNGGKEDRYGSTNDSERYSKTRDDGHSKENDDDWRPVHHDYTNGDDSTSRRTSLPSYEETKKKTVVKAAVDTSQLSGDDDDDFNPRASAPAPRATVAPQADLLDLDLFSATPGVDPFDSQNSSSTTSSSTVNAATSTGAPNFFASDAFPTSTEFGAFTSASTEPSTSTANVDPFGQLESLQFENKQPAAFSAFNDAASLNQQDTFDAFGGLSQAPAPAVAPPVQTTPSFQTKSSVWADSLTSGLIDLNITAPKSNHQEFGDWTKEEKQPVSVGLKGKAMGSGSGLGLAGASGLAPPPPPKMAADTFGFGSPTNAAFFSMAPGPVPTHPLSTPQKNPFANLM